MSVLDPSPTKDSSPTESLISFTPTDNNDVQENEKQVLLDFALSWDETKLAIYSNQGVYVYDLSTHEKIFVKTFENSDWTYQAGAITFSPDGTQIAISGKFADEPINILDMVSQKLIATFSDIPTGYWVSEIEFNPSGKKILARISKISCESVKDKFVLFDINGGTDWASSDLFALDRECIIFPPIISRFTHDDKLFVFNASPPTIIFNANTGQNISTELSNTEQIKNYYDISSDGKTAAIRDLHGNSTLLNIETGESLDVIQGKVLLLNNEKRFLVHDEKENQWNFRKNGENKCSYDGLRFTIYPGEFALSENGNFLAAHNSPEQELQVWDISSCKIIYSLPFN